MEKKSSIPWNLWSETWGKIDIIDQVPQPIVLPPSLEPHQWKRFHEIEHINPILHDSTDSPDLFTNNQHLLHSESIKWFCSSLTILNYCHEESGKKWQGWHHIYSPNKSRKVSTHNPQINPDGKYMIRLFFLGSWRCFITDDTIPLDKEGNPLLPRTQNTNELWPILLSKALLQIASLSSTKTHEIFDFNPIFNLTGWSYLSIKMSHLSPRDRWNLLIKYVPPEDIQLPQQNEIATKTHRTSKKGRPSKTKRLEKPEQKPLNTRGNPPIVPCLYLQEKFSKLPHGYPLYIQSTSDYPQDPSQIKPPLESWKLPRWISWAVRQGIIDPKDYLSPIRRILMVNHETNADWFDFNEIKQHPMDLHLFFKSEYFTCTRNISNLRHDDQEDLKTNLTKKNHFLHELKASRNEPLYLFVDSIDSKFFLFNYCVYEENLWSSLIIEKTCWFRQNLGNSSLLKIETRGSASKILCLTPGRHLLKIFCQSSAYCLNISSDKLFYVGKKREIQELMTTESEMIKFFANDVRSKLETAFQSFGLEKYSRDLRNYYQSYLPGNHGKLNKKDRKMIHEIFREEFVNFIETKSNYETIRALRIFFIDPEFGTSPCDHDVSLTNSSNEIAVKKIQSFFRMLRIKKYLRMHERTHEDHDVIRGILEETMKLFDEESVCQLVRKFMNRIIDFREFYPCSEDFDKILQLQKIKGKISTTSSEFIPIVHQSLMVNEEEMVFASLDLFIDLPFYILRTFDNETSREIQRIVNNVSPFRYKNNKNGFTVVAYGRSDVEKVNEIEWILHLMTIKDSPGFYIDPDGSNPGVHEVSNIYIPNSDNYVTKIVLKVEKSCIVSIRLQTSYSRAKIKILVFSETEKLLEVSGGSVVFLPVVKLLNIEEEYSIHVFVVEDSWPLTKIEWEFVEKAKKEREKNIFEEKSLENPFWRVQVLSDPGINLQVREDTRREMEILEKKILFIPKESSRLERGRNLQETFREDNCIQPDDSEEYLHDDVDVDEEIRTLSPFRDNRRLPPLNLSNFSDFSEVRTEFQGNNLFKYQEKSVHLMQHLEFMLMKSLRI